MNDLILGLYHPTGEAIAGGMGKVQRVHHILWDVDLAMKQPHPHLFETEAQKQNFIGECEAWINLGLHPHIVSCHYVREVNGIPSIFAEWMEGGTLSSWITSGKLYKGSDSDVLKRILDIAIQFAWGLDYAHDHGLIHQDVKPDNVMLTAIGDVKVADFGIAKAKRNLALSGTASGLLEGTLISNAGAYTPAYCAPEQSNGGTLSRRTDIWSWTVSVLEMFVGERLWSSGSVAGNACDTYFELARVQVPKLVKDLLRECFNENEAGRPHDFKIVAERLKSIFQMLTGEHFCRELPEAAKLHVDSLNNQAVSMLELGRSEQAERLFDQALEMERGHPQATYNQGLHLWRSGRMTDTTLVSALEQSQASRPNDWLPPYLLGRVHLERLDAEGAVAALLEALKLHNGAEIQEALAEARKIGPCKPKCLRNLDGHLGYRHSEAKALSADGRWALSKGLQLWEVSSGKCVRTFEGHNKGVYSVALSADARWVLSGGVDNTLCLWEVSSGKCVRTFDGHTNSVKYLALSKDNRWALSGSLDDTLRLWEVSSGKCVNAFEIEWPYQETLRIKMGMTSVRNLNNFEGHMDRVNSVSFSPDGRWGMSGSSDKTLRLWEMNSGRCLNIFKGHTEAVDSVAISADARYTLSGSRDRTLRLWEVNSGECVRIFEGHTNSVDSVALSADGRWALSGSTDETLRLWEVSSGMCVRTLEGHTDADVLIALSADGRTALSGTWDQTLRLWNISSLLDAQHIMKYNLVVCHVSDANDIIIAQKRLNAQLGAASDALSMGNYRIAYSLITECRSVPEFQFSTEALDISHQAGMHGIRSRLRNSRLFKTIRGHMDSTNSVNLAADEPYDRITELLQGGDGHDEDAVSHSANLVALSADGRWALSASYDKTLRLWEVSSGTYVRSFYGHTGDVLSVKISADGRLVLSGSLDKTLRLWDVNSGRCLRTFKGHTEHVTSVALSADGRWALSASFDKTLRLWDVSSGTCLRTFNNHNESVDSVALSADGRWALSACYDKHLRLWEVSSGNCLQTIAVGNYFVLSVTLSADGYWALSGSTDNTLCLWNVSSGKCVRTFEGHTNNVMSVALSADARYALSGSSDRTVRLWDIGSGKCVRTLHGHTNSVNSVALSSDCRWALSWSMNEPLCLWELDWIYEFPDCMDWDKSATPYLVSFLCQHTPYSAELPHMATPSEEQIHLALTRCGKPTWTSQDYQQLITQLQHVGFGWIRLECVERELKKMAADWQGPPSQLGPATAIMVKTNLSTRND